jgi:hypothetical protein
MILRITFEIGRVFTSPQRFQELSRRPIKISNSMEMIFLNKRFERRVSSFWERWFVRTHRDTDQGRAEDY